MKNGFQTQNNNVNPTAEQIKRRNKLHKEATKQADKSFSAACLAPEGRLIQTGPLPKNSFPPQTETPLKPCLSGVAITRSGLLLALNGPRAANLFSRSPGGNFVHLPAQLRLID